MFKLLTAGEGEKKTQVNVTDRDNEGRTPLHTAALAGQLDVLRLLLGFDDGEGDGKVLTNCSGRPNWFNLLN